MNSNNLTQLNLPEDFNPLALENQVCFSLYVCSKEIIRSYEPLLKPLGLTYTAYITLLALWEKDNVSVKELGEKLFLDSGTLTPLLKKMEQQNLVVKTRSKEDERTVLISLTDEGKALRTTCLEIPQKMMCKKLLEPEDAADLIKNLHEIMGNIKKEA